MESATAYDVAIANCWSEMLKRPFSVDEPRLWLPLKSGGFGMASARARVNAAPWAAWTAVMDQVVVHMGAVDAEDLFNRVPCLGQWIGALHARLVEQGAPACIAYNSPLRALAVGATQKYLVAHMHRSSLRALRAGLDTNECAFLRSASGPAAGAFLEVPLDDRWAMSNSRIATACCRRLGLPFPGYDDPPTTSLRCRNVSAQGNVCGAVCDKNGMHPECCAPGGGLVQRHDGIVRCLGSLAARALDPWPKLEQIVPELAQNVPGQAGQARLDVVVHDGTERLLVDVVVVSAYAGDASFRACCARRDGFASRRAAIAKRSRYPTPDLVPFAMETGGRLGTDARAFIARMANAAENRSTERSYLHRAISSVMQDGVAKHLQPK